MFTEGQRQQNPLDIAAREQSEPAIGCGDLQPHPLGVGARTFFVALRTSKCESTS